MLQFAVDPHDPLGALESCGLQLDMLTDLLCQGEAGGVMLGDQGSAGLADLLRALSGVVNESVDIIRRVYPAALQIIEREAAAPPDEVLPTTRSERLALIARLLAEETDASDTLAGRSSAAGGAASPAPRLTEPRPSGRRRRAEPEPPEQPRRAA
jgi:hypothetical protein